MSVKVTLYSGPKCQQCIATIRSLDAAGIAYTKVDTSEDLEAQARLVAAGMRTLPVVEIDGVISWSGFSPSMIAGLIDATKAA